MSHQNNFNGPEFLDAPLDFLSRFIRGICLWPFMALGSVALSMPFIFLLCDVEQPDETDRLIGRVILGAAALILAPALAMAQAFHQRGQATPWGSGGGGRPPEDPPDFPKPPEPSKPAVEADDVSSVPDPDWFRQTAPADLREKEMNR